MLAHPTGLDLPSRIPTNSRKRTLSICQANGGISTSRAPSDDGSKSPCRSAVVDHSGSVYRASIRERISFRDSLESRED